VNWRSRLPIVTALLLLGCSPTAGAQSTRTADEQQHGVWTVAPFVGVAWDSPTDAGWGTTPDRDHLFVGLHLATPVLRLGRVSLSYAPNVVPLVVVTNNPRYEVQASPGGSPPQVLEIGRGRALGAGLSPLGLQLAVRPAPAIEVFAAGAVGGLWFNERVPTYRARHFNYTFEWGGGLHVRIAERRALQLGYKFHHLSNLYTAEANPGVDGHVFYAGLQWTLRAPR
jgi:hypothetical protein